jgi:hypothetical protein
MTKYKELEKEIEKLDRITTKEREDYEKKIQQVRGKYHRGVARLQSKYRSELIDEIVSIGDIKCKEMEKGGFHLVGIKYDQGGSRHQIYDWTLDCLLKNNVVLRFELNQPHIRAEKYEFRGAYHEYRNFTAYLEGLDAESIHSVYNNIKVPDAVTWHRELTNALWRTAFSSESTGWRLIGKHIERP